jgi:ribosomal protein S19
MSVPKVSADAGSTAVGGNVGAPIVNVTTGNASNVHVNVEHKIAQEVPSFLGAVIAVFSEKQHVAVIIPDQRTALLQGFSNSSF